MVTISCKVSLVITHIKIPMLTSCLLFKLKQIHCHLYYNVILTTFFPFFILIFSGVGKKYFDYVELTVTLG